MVNSVPRWEIGEVCRSLGIAADLALQSPKAIKSNQPGHSRRRVISITGQCEEEANLPHPGTTQLSVAGSSLGL